MAKKFIAMAVTAGVLMGCGSTTPPPSEAQIRAFHAQQCADYGFEPGSTAFANCLLEMDVQRKEDARAAQYRNSGPAYYGSYGSTFGRYRSRGYGGGIGFGF